MSDNTNMRESLKVLPVEYTRQLALVNHQRALGHLTLQEARDEARDLYELYIGPFDRPTAA